MTSRVLTDAARPKPPNAGKGRVKGVPNKTTRLIKEAFAEAFDKLGGADALVTWGRDNQTEFYKLASKLIPIQAEHSGPDGGPIQSQLDVSHLSETTLRELAASKIEE